MTNFKHAKKLLAISLITGGLIAAPFTFLNNTNRTEAQTGQQQQREFILRRNLGPGSRGDDVKMLQRFLISNGFLARGLDTGFYGQKTTEAVKALQRRIGINPTGMVGPRTRQRLMELSGRGGGGGTTTPPTSNAGEIARALQDALSRITSSLPQNIQSRSLEEAITEIRNRWRGSEQSFQATFRGLISQLNQIGNNIR